MLIYGEPGSDTAVSRTVAIPAAISVKMILDGKINVKGLYRPVVPEIYEPVLDELKANGIKPNKINIFLARLSFLIPVGIHDVIICYFVDHFTGLGRI